MWGDHMTSRGNKAKKLEGGWGRTKSEKGREVTNTGGGGLWVGKPLPTMCSECKEIVLPTMCSECKEIVFYKEN